MTSILSSSFHLPFLFSWQSICWVVVACGKCVIPAHWILFWGLSYRIRHNNSSRRESKRNRRKSRGVEDHLALQTHTIGLSKTTTLATPIHWKRVKYLDLNLYHTIPLDKNKIPIHCPTHSEVKSAISWVHTTSSFFALAGVSLLILMTRHQSLWLWSLPLGTSWPRRTSMI